MIVLDNLILLEQKKEKQSLRVYTQIIKIYICNLEKFVYKYLKIGRKRGI